MAATLPHKSHLACGATAVVACLMMFNVAEPRQLAVARDARQGARATADCWWWFQQPPFSLGLVSAPRSRCASSCCWVPCLWLWVKHHHHHHHHHRRHHRRRHRLHPHPLRRHRHLRRHRQCGATTRALTPPPASLSLTTAHVRMVGRARSPICTVWQHSARLAPTAQTAATASSTHHRLHRQCIAMTRVRVRQAIHCAKMGVQAH